MSEAGGRLPAIAIAIAIGLAVTAVVLATVAVVVVIQRGEPDIETIDRTPLPASRKVAAIDVAELERNVVEHARQLDIYDSVKAAATLRISIERRGTPEVIEIKQTP